MERKKRKSGQYLRRYSIINTANNQSKTSTKKESYENGLSKIFSSPPSHLGYKNDIESLLNELELKNDQLLNFVISSLSKIVRNKNEIKIIASYLYLMPNFIKLLKGKNKEKKEQDILKDLLNLSQSISYEKHQKDSILMKFGDKGSTAYIILDGKVDVFVKSFKNMYITKNDYLFYLATLLKYSEYGLLNEAINENFAVFPIEIYDSSNVKHLDIDGINQMPENNNDKEQNKTIKNLSESPVKNDNIFRNSKTMNNLEEKKSIEDRHNSSFNSIFKLNEENEQIKEYKSIFSISINKLLKMFNIKKLDKKNIKLQNCPINEYINRIELIPDHYKICINKNLINRNIIYKNNNNNNDNSITNKTDIEKDTEKNIIKKEDIDNDSEEENKIYNLKIYNYIKVATLGKGTLFGEIALSEANSLRTGTLITSSECHFTVLSKRIFDNCIKKGAEKYIKELLTFCINLPIFIGLPESLFYHKYYTYLSKKVLLRGNLVITQGEKPKNIILVQTGTYGLSTRMSLYDLTKLLYHLINMNLKNKNNNIYDEDNIKYNRLLKKTKNFMNEAKSLMNENLKFKKYYLSEMYIRITDISCPDIVGYKEYLDENGLYAFSMETKSPENIIFTLDNKFYSDLQQRNFTVRKNQKELLEKKINAIIQRLLIIRNSLVNSFFDDLGEKQISSLIMKELENINNIKLKQKRFLKFKSIEYKFNKKTLEDKDYEINKSINNNNIRHTKSKKIKIFSRNYKSNNSMKYFNSFNLGEENEKQNKKSINHYYKIYPNSNKNKNDKNNNINKKITNLYRASKNYYSTKNIFENNKQIIKKKKIIDIDSKEKTEISNHTLKEYGSKNNNKLNQENNKTNNNSEINSKRNKEIKNLIKDNKFPSPLTSPKIYSANNSYRNSQIKGVVFNSLVWEEINKKLSFNNDIINKMNLTQRNLNFKNIFEKSNSSRRINNEELKTPFNSGRYSSRTRFNENKKIKIKFYNSPSLLHKSTSELNIKNNLKIKSNIFKKINSPKYSSSYDLSKRNKNKSIDNNNNLNRYYSSLERNKVPKIKLKIKKIFSPEQIKLIREINKKRNDINIMKYHESKIEKYKLDRNFYYNNNLKNRIKLFYGSEKK